MNNDEYQKSALRNDLPVYGEVGGSQYRLIHSALGISGEAGEVADIIKKHVMYGKTLDVSHLKEEVGDVLWYMAILLDEIGSSFSEVMELNNHKLLKRYPDGFTKENALERIDKK